MKLLIMTHTHTYHLALIHSVNVFEEDLKTSLFVYDWLGSLGS
jgi:hypothetical protein